MTTPDVSVIMPVFNSSRSLERAVRSVLDQTLENIELIAVDDGSSDDSVHILENIAKNDGRIHIFKQGRNTGTFSARRRGVSGSAGKYLLFLDPDDTLEPEAAAVLLETARKESASIVSFGTNEFAGMPDGSVKQVWNWVNPPPGKVESPSGILKDLLADGGHYWNLALKVIKRGAALSALEKTSDFYCVMGEDMLFYIAAAAASDRLVKTDKNLYNYYIDKGITARSGGTLESYKKLLTLLDALYAAEKLLAAEKFLDLKPLESGFYSMEHSQYFMLWGKLFELESIEERHEGARLLFAKAPSVERAVIYLGSIAAMREAKFAVSIPKNCFGNNSVNVSDPGKILDSEEILSNAPFYDPSSVSSAAARFDIWKNVLPSDAKCVKYDTSRHTYSEIFIDILAIKSLGAGLIVKEKASLRGGSVKALFNARAFDLLADKVELCSPLPEDNLFFGMEAPDEKKLNALLFRLDNISSSPDPAQLSDSAEFIKFAMMLYRFGNRLLPKNSYLRMMIKGFLKRRVRGK